MNNDKHPTMNLDELTQLTNNPDFIEGIYNYCDRWCERCPFTQRCANVAIGRAQFPDGEPHDLESTEFWEGITSVFQNTLELLQQAAVEQGIDLADPELNAALDHDEALRTQAEEDPCAEAAFLYTEFGFIWFEEAADLFTAKEEDLNMLARLNVADGQTEQQAAEITDAVEVIQWYLDFIYVKLQRALHGQLEEAEDPEAWEGYPKDSDGSAKVALIAMDRSIGAWGQLLRHFPERETSVLEVLAHLDRLRRAVEAQFPAARSFVRPGFDTGEFA